MAAPRSRLGCSSKGCELEGPHGRERDPRGQTPPILRIGRRDRRIVRGASERRDGRRRRSDALGGSRSRVERRVSVTPYSRASARGSKERQRRAPSRGGKERVRRLKSRISRIGPSRRSMGGEIRSESGVQPPGWTATRTEGENSVSSRRQTRTRSSMRAAAATFPVARSEPPGSSIGTVCHVAESASSNGETEGHGT